VSPNSPTVVSSTVAFHLASHWCREWEDSLLALTDLFLSPASVEANAVRNPSLVMGLIRQGFFGPRVTSPRSVDKEASLSTQSCKDPLDKADENPALAKGVAKLGRSISQAFPCMMEGGAPIYSSVSKLQLGYSWRVKEKVSKELHKKEELLAEVVVETPMERVEGYFKGALDAINLAPDVGLSWGGEDNNLLDLFSVIDKREPIIDNFAPKVKGDEGAQKS
jgi:hypothetical protein